MTQKENLMMKLWDLRLPARMLISALLIGLLGAGCSTPSSDPAALPKGTTVPQGSNRELLDWNELLPAGWNPLDAADKALHEKHLSMFSPEGKAVVRAVLDNAPPNPILDGSYKTLGGYAVPLEYTDEGVTEFLLVPYFGAAIQNPAPASNQAVHVLSSKPIKELHTMDRVCVEGYLSVQQSSTFRGKSTYMLNSERIGPLSSQGICEF
ncbi:MAG: DUF3299 domain-containing protein [Aquabacterium sp.]